MKKWKKILISYLMICSAMAKIWSVNAMGALAKEDWGTDTELLIVLDNSGSMKETGKEMEEVVGLIGKLLETRDIRIPVSYLLFNEDAYYVEDGQEIRLETGKETCIWQGIEHTDYWIKERIAEGKSVKLLFISDFFSSRRLENNGIACYTFETASEEQENISEVVEQWNQWQDEKKLDFVVWTWESLCKGEDSRNTIAYLKKHDKEAVGKGYQVVIDCPNRFMLNWKKDKTTFIKYAVTSFESLLYGIDEKWRSWNIVGHGKKERKISEGHKGCYIYFPDIAGIEVEEGKLIYKNLYWVEANTESIQVVISSDNKKKSKGYILQIPDLQWKINVDTRIKEDKEFSLQVTPNFPLSGAWGKPEDYVCRVEIYQNNIMVQDITLNYNSDKEKFVGKCTLGKTGEYKLAGYINDKEMCSVTKKVN